MQSEEKKPKKKRSIASIIINVIFALILILVFIITISMIISSFSGKNYTSIFGRAFFAVKTESMSPTGKYNTHELKEGEHKGFEVGDLIIVQELGSDWEWGEVQYDGNGISYVTEKSNKMTLRTGDIISFNDQVLYGGENIDIINTHRIIKIYENERNGNIYFTTKGDNNEEPDSERADGLKTDLSLDKVIGKYNGTNLGWIGNIVLFMENPVGYWIVIGIPVFAILLYCIITFVLTITKRNKTAIADEKANIRQQIIDELRAQGLAVPAAGSGSVNAEAGAGGGTAAVAAENISTVTAAVITENKTENKWDDGIPVIEEADIDASIAKIQEELYASSGLAGEDIAEGEPAAEAAAPAKKAAATSGTAAKKTASGTAAKKTAATAGTAAAKKTTTSAAKASSSKSGSSKTSAAKSGGLIGTGAKKTTNKKDN